MKDAWPVRASAGGHYRAITPIRLSMPMPSIYFADRTSCGSTAARWVATTVCQPRTARRARQSFQLRRTPAKCRIYRGIMSQADLVWKSLSRTEPAQLGWDHSTAIRNDEPHNEVKRGVEASLVTSMGRMAAHRPGGHIRRHAQLQAQFALTRQADHDFGGAPPGRQQRQISSAATGTNDPPGISD